MKIAIIGVGAIGGYVGIRLALAGEDVTFIARGANLEALQSRGIRLVTADGEDQTVANVKATDDYAAAGPQDLVILAMKAHQVEAVAREVPKLFGPDTVVVPMQNGIPYWYFHGYPGALAGARVHSVDPSGLIGEHIPGERVIGCVVYPAAELLSHGVIKHVEGNRFPRGRTGRHDERAGQSRIGVFHQGRIAGARARRHPRRDLAEAMGQLDVQSDQRAVARDSGRHLPVSAQPCRRRGDDG